MKTRISIAVGGILTLVANSSAIAADVNGETHHQENRCAVSAPNLKLEAAGGSIDSSRQNGGRHHASAAITIPLECRFGAQFDVSVGELDGQDTWGVGGHLFARDPSSHLIGIYASHSEVNGIDISRFAAEGEIYNGQFTLTGLVGVEDSDVTDSEVFGVGRLSFYATDNFMIHGGVASFLDTTIGTVGFEYQAEGTNVSLFANAGFGENDYSTYYGGIRFYFGEQKELINRHREDDPWIWDDVLQAFVFIDQPDTQVVEDVRDQCMSGYTFVESGDRGRCIEYEERAE